MNLKIHWQRHAALYQVMVTIAILMLLGMIYTQSITYVYLAWNLLLAWIPLAISSKIKNIAQQAKWLQAICLLIWLLFLPNALYIVTDLIHINAGARMPLWHQAVLLYMAATAGLYMGYGSLIRVEAYILKHHGKAWAQCCSIGSLMLAGYGVYLGRWGRWNSWDVLYHPLGLGSEIMAHILSPWAYKAVWGITFILALVYWALYRIFQQVVGSGYTKETKHPAC